MKNKLQPTKTSFSRSFQCKKAPRWLSKFFHFGTENGEEQLKKHPVYYTIYTKTSTSTFHHFLTQSMIQELIIFVIAWKSWTVWFFPSWKMQYTLHLSTEGSSSSPTSCSAGCAPALTYVTLGLAVPICFTPRFSRFYQFCRRPTQRRGPWTQLEQPCYK